MKQFKTLAFTGFLTLAVFSMIGYSSCSKDKCEGVQCQNGGTCVDGNCQCPAGFEGISCESKKSAKFVGIFSATDDCPFPDPPVRMGNDLKYSITISPSNVDVTKLTIKGVGNTDVVLNSTMDAEGKVLSIPEQNMSDGRTYSGTLTYQSVGSLKLNFNIKQGGSLEESCTSNLVKQ